MSRVYDALQQSISGVDTATLQTSSADAVFAKQFPDSGWDPNAAPSVQPDLFEQERLPALFSVHSLASEQFRLLATRLQQLQHSRLLKSVLVTSAVAGEGKSLLSFNLAVSLAQGGRQKILLIDADLRKPGLPVTIDVNGRARLREWHQTQCPISECICRVADLNVWLVPAGQLIVDPLELLKSPRISDLFSFVNAAFDWVLIDAPPLLPLADAEILSRLCDATILVVRHDRSPKRALKQALERVPAAKLAGLLLNGFPVVNTYGYRQYAIEQDSNKPRGNGRAAASGNGSPGKVG